MSDEEDLDNVVPIIHGTYNGYLRCRFYEFGPCVECKNAYNKYMKQWRKTSPEAYSRSKKQQALRGKALRRLAAEYPTRFQAIMSELYQEANSKVGSENGPNSVVSEDL